MIGLDALATIVSEFYGIRNIFEATRKADVVWARHVFMFLAYGDGTRSYGGLAGFMGYEHTTVMHGVKRITDACKHSERTRLEIEHLADKIKRFSESSAAPLARKGFVTL